LTRIRIVPTPRTVLATLAGVSFETLLCCLFLREALPDVLIVFLLGVVVAALCAGRIMAIGTAVVSVAVIDFFFTVPYYSFVVADSRHVLTFVVFMVVAYVIGDLTERVRRARAEAQARELEAFNEQIRSSLLSSVSHDLRGPLAVMINASSALLDREAEMTADARRDYLAAIADEAARLSRLVRHLIDATSLQSGPVRVRKEWTLLEEVVGVALTRLGDTLGTRPVDIRIDPDASMVPVDGTLLEQVFLNLLENAAKHTPPRTPVAIVARRVVEGVEVAVADAGAGVPRGLQERIFDKFERAVNSGGMGLGLAICRGIVAAHGGRIWCESGEGSGATFRFVLPRGTIPELAEE
jgi:two-component system sensor histidine kinase KdpD